MPGTVQDVVFFGAYDADRHPRVAVLVEGFRRHGCWVREVNVPLEFDTAKRVALLQQPGRLIPLLARLILTWLQLWWRARAVGTPDAVVVGHLAHLDVHLARWLWPDTPIVIDYLISAEGTALDRRAGSATVRSVLRRVDRAALRAADVVLVDTEENREALPPLVSRDGRRPRPVVAPVGVGREWFAARGNGEARRARGVDDEALSVVFFGLYTPLQGTETIGRAIARLSDAPVGVTMVGRGQDYPRARAAAGDAAHVEWVDWVPAPELPGVVAAHDVCLGIFGTTEKAHRVVPNKVYQGATAGCAIVTGDTRPQRGALGDAALYVPPGDADALAGALRRLADDPDELARLRAAAADRADAAFRPDVVVRPLLEALGATPVPDGEVADPVAGPLAVGGR